MSRLKSDYFLWFTFIMSFNSSHLALSHSFSCLRFFVSFGFIVIMWCCRLYCSFNVFQKDSTWLFWVELQAILAQSRYIFFKIVRMKNENKTRKQCVKKEFIRSATEESALRKKTDWTVEWEKKTNQDTFNKSELMKSKIKMYFSACFFWLEQQKSPN